MKPSQSWMCGMWHHKPSCLGAPGHRPPKAPTLPTLGLPSQDRDMGLPRRLEPDSSHPKRLRKLSGLVSQGLTLLSRPPGVRCQPPPLTGQQCLVQHGPSCLLHWVVSWWVASFPRYPQEEWHKPLILTDCLFEEACPRRLSYLAFGRGPNGVAPGGKNTGGQLAWDSHTASPRELEAGSPPLVGPISPTAPRPTSDLHAGAWRSARGGHRGQVCLRHC